MCGISADNFWAHIALSSVVALLCAGAGILALRWSNGPGGITLFTAGIDPDRGLQRLYGWLGITAAVATLVCPFLPHWLLPYVHGTIGWVCIILISLFIPRLFYAYIMRELALPKLA